MPPPTGNDGAEKLSRQRADNPTRETQAGRANALISLWVRSVPYRGTGSSRFISGGTTGRAGVSCARVFEDLAHYCRGTIFASVCGADRGITAAFDRRFLTPAVHQPRFLRYK
mgnify:CR=1 FL=1